jgi:hypothetical protein
MPKDKGKHLLACTIFSRDCSGFPVTQLKLWGNARRGKADGTISQRYIESGRLKRRCVTLLVDTWRKCGERTHKRGPSDHGGGEIYRG